MTTKTPLGAWLDEVEQDLCETGLCDSNPIAQKAIAGLRAFDEMHAPKTLWLAYPDAEFSYETPEAAWEYRIDDAMEDEDVSYEDINLEHLDSFQVCSACSAIAKEATVDCDEFPHGTESATYPCPSRVVIETAVGL